MAGSCVVRAKGFWEGDGANGGHGVTSNGRGEASLVGAVCFGSSATEDRDALKVLLAGSCRQRVLFSTVRRQTGGVMRVTAIGSAVLSVPRVGLSQKEGRSPVSSCRTAWTDPCFRLGDPTSWPDFEPRVRHGSGGCCAWSVGSAVFPAGLIGSFRLVQAAWPLLWCSCSCRGLSPGP